MSEVKDCPVPLQLEHTTRLVRIEEGLRTLTDQQVSNSKKLDDMHKALVGDVATPGLGGRVDRLEQNANRNAWWLRTIGAAAIAALFGWVKK